MGSCALHPFHLEKTLTLKILLSRRHRCHFFRLTATESNPSTTASLPSQPPPLRLRPIFFILAVAFVFRQSFVAVNISIASRRSSTCRHGLSPGIVNKRAPSIRRVVFMCAELRLRQVDPRYTLAGADPRRASLCVPTSSASCPCPSHFLLQS